MYGKSIVPSDWTWYSFGRSFSPTTVISKRSPGPTPLLVVAAGRFFGGPASAAQPTRVKRPAKTTAPHTTNALHIRFFVRLALHQPTNAQVGLKALPLHGVELRPCFV